MARGKLLALIVVGSFAGIAAAIGCGEALGGGSDGDDSDDAGSASTDALVGDARAGDASSELAPRCDPNGAWQTPVRLDSISSEGDDEASVTLASDELTIFVERSTPATANSAIYIATRASTDVPFSALAIVPELDTRPVFTGQPFLTNDGRSLYLTRSSNGTGGDIVRVDRASADAPFSGAPQPVVATADDDRHPQVFGTDLWYCAKKPTNGFLGIHVRPLAAPDPADASASNALTMPGDDGNDAFYDLQPVIDPTGLTLYFASTRDGGTYAIYEAHRATPAETFSSPKRVDALSSTAGDFISWISPDGCHAYLTSRRAGPTLDVFMSSRAAR